MSQRLTFRCSGAPSHHMLIAATNISRHHSQNNAMFSFAVASRYPFWQFELGILDGFDTDLAGLFVDNTPISWHMFLLSLECNRHRFILMRHLCTLLLQLDTTKYFITNKKGRSTKACITRTENYLNSALLCCGYSCL